MSHTQKGVKACLTSRYPRDRYILTDKLTGNFFKTEEDIRPLFESQLEACGVDYFDFYLMHAQGAGNYGHYKECHPGSVRHHEHQAALPRLERRLLLQCSTYRTRPESF